MGPHIIESFMAADTIRVRAVARGRVQMVGYRAFVLTHAERHGLRGTVRNEPDGSVEAVLEGPQEAVDQVLAELRRGPSHARVDALDVCRLAPTGELPPMTVTA